MALRASVASDAKDTAAEDGNAVDYSKTVLLPKTDFPQRADSSNRERAIQKLWADTNLYERLFENNPGPQFVLHDGPPYANGDLHIGHALNKILKDIINRWRCLRGNKARGVACGGDGWW